MALEEDQKKQIISQINNSNFDAAAEMITGVAGENDHNEVVSEFLENMAQKGGSYISEKINLVKNIVLQNLQQKPNILEDALYMALKDVPHPSEGAAGANENTSSVSDLSAENMSLNEIENNLNSLKSQQALLIRTNKPLDPEISKKIKEMQEVRDRLYQENAADAQNNKPKSSSGWFNFASHSEISETLDYEVCQGTPVTQAIKDRMDKDVARGRIILSKQDSIKKAQIKEFMSLYVADMPDITDGDEFVKESSKIFDNYNRLEGKILENSQGIDHGGVFKIGTGWLVIIRQKQSDSTIPQHQFFVFDVDPSIYFTIRFHRRFTGGKIYPDAYTMIELKGSKSISLVQSSKGENVIDTAQLQRIKTQVNSYQKTFEEITNSIASSKLREPAKMSELEVINKVKQEELKVKDLDGQQDNTPKASEAVSVTSKEDKSSVIEKTEKDLKPQIEDSRKAAKPAAEEVHNKVQEQVNPEIQEKIDNLQGLLHQAQINNQTSTVERLQKDIQQLEAQKYGKETGDNMAENVDGEQVASDDFVDDGDIEFDEESVLAAISKMPYDQNIKDLMGKALTYEFDYDKMDNQGALKLVEEFFAHMHYEDLIRLRNKLTTNAKYIDLLPYFDAYMTDYIELAYIAGDYHKKAEEILQESDKKSKDIVQEEEKISKELESLAGKDLTASDLNKKISLQNRLEELDQMGAQVTLDIEKAKIYLDADIQEIERLDHDAEQNVARKKLHPESDAEKDKLIEKYKDKLQKVSEKLPAMSGEEFSLSEEDVISDDQLKKFDASKISAKSLSDLAIALGEPVDLADEKKAQAVLDTVSLVKVFDKYIGQFFKKVEKHKHKIKSIKKALEKTQSQIIEHEKELESIKIANKVKLTPMIEERKLLEQKIANLESN